MFITVRKIIATNIFFNSDNIVSSYQIVNMSLNFLMKENIGLNLLKHIFSKNRTDVNTTLDGSPYAT